MFVEAQFQFLMRQREGFHTAACSGIYIHRHSRCNSLSVATSYRCISSGTSCLPKELEIANIGILKALETFSKERKFIVRCPLVVPLLMQR